MVGDKPEIKVEPQTAAGLVDLSVRHDLSGDSKKSGRDRTPGQNRTSGQDNTTAQAQGERTPGLPHLEISHKPGAHSEAHSGAPSGAPAEAQTLSALNGQFTKILDHMKQEGHHWDTRLPWLQNLSDSRKCYSQAGEMGRALREWIDRTPGLKGNFIVQEGTINEGKGEDPRDFYTGNGEHNFIVVTNKTDGTKYYGDPWSGKPFSRDPLKSVHNFKGQKIWEHEFEQ